MNDMDKENQMPEPVDDSPDSSEPVECGDDLNSLRAEREELLGRLQRVSADYMNYQKRAERERQDMRTFVIADLVSAFAEVIDDLELAIGHARENSPEDPLLAGTDMVYRKAMEMFKRFGVEPIESVGATFDPALHEALQMQPTTEAEPMTILYEVRKGYILKERTVRPARVIVATEPQEESPQNEDQAGAAGE